MAVFGSLAAGFRQRVSQAGRAPGKTTWIDLQTMNQTITSAGPCIASSGLMHAGSAGFFHGVFDAAPMVGAPERGLPSAREVRPHDAAVRTTVATSREQQLAAAALVCERYEWRGYSTGSIVSDALDTRRPATTLVTESQGHFVGTMTLGFDGPAGLWLEHTYPEPVAAARAAGRVLVELTRLAVAPGQDSRGVLASLFATAYRVGRLDHGATDLYIEVNPRHAPVYSRLFGFVPASGLRVCGRVKAPAVLLCLDIVGLDARMSQFMEAAPSPLAAAA